MGQLISKEETKILKGIAILMVVVEHIGQVLDIGIVNPLGPIGVFLFLFLSGYGLTCSYQLKGRVGFLQKRVLKVYLPYAFTVLLFVGWCYLINMYHSISEIVQYFVLVKLPQGSYWYLVLLFYWYIIFYISTYYMNALLKMGMIFIVATLVIIVVHDFNRLFIWQFASFPAGVIYAKKAEVARIIEYRIKNFRGGILFLIVAVVMVGLKKMPYVEARELGMVDTLLQIGITWTIGGFVLIFREIFIRVGWIKKVLLLIGGISYELYLAHVLPLDYLKVSPSGGRMIIYVIALIIIVILLEVQKNSNYFLRRK